MGAGCIHIHVNKIDNNVHLSDSKYQTLQAECVTGNDIYRKDICPYIFLLTDIWVKQWLEFRYVKFDVCISTNAGEF